MLAQLFHSCKRMASAGYAIFEGSKKEEREKLSTIRN